MRQNRAFWLQRSLLVSLIENITENGSGDNISRTMIRFKEWPLLEGSSEIGARGTSLKSSCPRDVAAAVKSFL